MLGSSKQKDIFVSRMLNGRWLSEDDIATVSTSGEYQREDSVLRDWIGTERYPSVAGRYHLYVAYNCPWAHRTLILRALKCLDDVVTVSVVKPRRTDQGWVFGEGEFCDHLYGSDSLHDIYRRALDDYTGRVTVPVLFDKQTESIVSNESSEIIRMLNDGFNEFTACATDYYPQSLRADIDNWNKRIYHAVNNGVYRAGFASTQQAYESAVTQVFAALDDIEAHLKHHPYLAGDCITEADLRLFPILARFDVAYHGAFKCNLKRLVDYPALWRYARDLYHQSGIAATVKFEFYKQGYYSPSEKRNPLGIVPLGPLIDWALEPDTSGN